MKTCKNISPVPCLTTLIFASLKFHIFFFFIVKLNTFEREGYSPYAVFAKLPDHILRKSQLSHSHSRGNVLRHYTQQHYSGHWKVLNLLESIQTQLLVLITKRQRRENWKMLLDLLRATRMGAIQDCCDRNEKEEILSREHRLMNYLALKLGNF